MLSVTSATVSGPSQVPENTTATYDLSAVDDTGNGTNWQLILPDGSYGGAFYVGEGQTGQYPYNAADEGTDSLAFHVTDSGSCGGDVPDTAYDTSPQSIQITDSGLSFQNATGVSAVEGDSSSTIIIGTLIDLDPGASTDDYLGTQIQWGDNTPSSDAQFVPTNTDQQGNPITQGSAFLVEAQHTYAEEGKPTASTTIQDDGGKSAPGSTQVALADAQLNAQGVDATTTVGDPFGGVIATFTDTDPGASSIGSGLHTAKIDWGDGSNTDSTDIIASDGNGGWVVSGSHAYANQGLYNGTVTIKDAGGQIAIANFNGNANLPVVQIANDLTFHVGETKNVKVTLYKQDGTTPSANQDLSVEISDNSLFWKQHVSVSGSVTTGADGTAQIAVTGKGNTTSANHPLELDASKGNAKDSKQVTVRRTIVKLTPNVTVSVNAGAANHKQTVTATVYDEDGVTKLGAGIVLSIDVGSLDEKLASVGFHNGSTTAADGTLLLDVTGNGVGDTSFTVNPDDISQPGNNGDSNDCAIHVS